MSQRILNQVETRVVPVGHPWELPATCCRLHRADLDGAGRPAASRLESARDKVGDAAILEPQLGLPGVNVGQLEEIIDQTAEVGNLSLHRLVVSSDGVGVGYHFVVNALDHRLHSSQWGPQVVGDGGHEFAPCLFHFIPRCFSDL